MTTSLTNAAIRELYILSNRASEQGMAMVNGFSGADKAESEIYFCASRAYAAMARGTPLADAVAAQDVAFREYARESAKKIAAAPKIKLGPMSGQSSIHHRYVAPDAFERYAFPHMKLMAERAMGQEEDPTDSTAGLPVHLRAGYVAPPVSSVPATASVVPFYSAAADEAREASRAMKARRAAGDIIASAEYEVIGKLWQKAALAHEKADRHIQAEQMRANAGSFFAAAGKPKASAKPLTFAQARSALLDALRGQGWAVNGALKVPHATSPSGRVRLWFKPQAVYVSTGGEMKDMGSARSWSSDIREDAKDPERFASTTEAAALR